MASRRDQRYVVHGLLIRDETILLLHRCVGRYEGDRWDLPGGAVEPGEAPTDAVVREVFEETGLAVEVQRELIRQTNLDTHGRPIEFVTITYVLQPRESIGAVRLCADEHDDWQWVKLDDVHCVEVVWHVIPAVKKLLKTHPRH